MNPVSPGASRRDTAMDTARGIAVAGMIAMHLVPLDGLNEGIASLLEGTSAALFFILIGMAWAIQADRSDSAGSRQRVVRRSLTLVGLGLLVHVLVWPTEVLLPFGIMLAPTLWIRSLGRRAVVVAIALLLAIALLGASWFAAFAEVDWLADGSHVADSTFGWVTLRSLLIDGNYPVVPWLAFSLLGTLFVHGGIMLRDRIRLWLTFGLAGGVSMWLLTNWTTSHADSLGNASKYVATTWVPTTVPFMLMKGGLATAVIAGLELWHQSSGLPKVSNLIANVGRASLTHYLGHICLVFAPLRYFYPGEDWPLRVGLIAWVVYLAAAVPLSWLWFRSHKRGPLEQFLGWASGAAPAR